MEVPSLPDPHAAPETQRISANPLARSFATLSTAPAPPRLNLVLLEFDPDALFAGVKTALGIGELASQLMGTSARLVLLKRDEMEAAERAEFTRTRLERLSTVFGGVRWEIVSGAEITDTRFGEDDLWVATHWMTAHALDIAGRSRSIQPSQVIYLVQDYEPQFFAGADERDCAESTYAAGFTLLVNGVQVARYLRSRGYEVLASHVFAPQFDTWHLQQAAARRSWASVPRIFFYGRPSKPRNMFGLGIETLRMTAAKLRAAGRDTEFVMAGEQGDDVTLGTNTVMRNLGLLDRVSYFDALSHVDVGLALQATPHPSHLPFDLALSGALAVTNEVDGSRHTMHPRIIAVEGSPEALSDALLHALTSARRRPPGIVGYLPPRNGQLGASMPEAVRATIQQMRGRLDS